MTDFNNQVVAQALLRVGRPFTTHEIGDAPCAPQNGRVLDSPDCQYRTVDQNGEGYDCDGLIRGAICEAAGVSLGDFSVDYTHSQQWLGLAQKLEKPRSNYIVLFCNGAFNVVVHTALQMDGGRKILHATEQGDAVRFGLYLPTNDKVRYVDPSQLAELAIRSNS